MTDTVRNTLPAPSKAWPYEEARRLAERLRASGQREALLETGYGPSGLPHIGTFGEVARTSWVRRAFAEITAGEGFSARLVAFSDDMDGLRKVPDNVPRREMLAEFLGRPLTAIPDPFGTHGSFGEHNNARLCRFLDDFGFDYTFASATDYYRSGRFDATLLVVLERFEAVRAAVLPTLGPERRATYSPVLPIHPVTGVVMQVPMERVDAEAGTVAWRDPADGHLYETPVTGGAAKLQWKADWAMRWAALGVDYEMSGKDLIDSVRLSAKICRIIGAEPPLSYTYELFLDEHGQKISKSKGNGLSVEEWLRYAPQESLSQFMYAAPQRAKRLFFDVIPKATDDYIQEIANYEAAATPADPRSLAAWSINGGAMPAPPSPIAFSMLLNLASVVNADSAATLWGFIRRYAPGVTPENTPFLDRLVQNALAYYRDFVRPKKRYRCPTAQEREALETVAATLAAMPADAPAAELQAALFEAGKSHGFADNLRGWFACLYEVLLGQQEGPRFGNFVAIYGIAPTVALIRDALARPQTTAADAA